MADITTEETIETADSAQETKTEKEEVQDSAQSTDEAESAEQKSPVDSESPSANEPEDKKPEEPTPPAPEESASAESESETTEQPQSQQESSPNETPAETAEAQDPQPEQSEPSEQPTASDAEPKIESQDLEPTEHPVSDAIQELTQSDPAACFSSWTPDSQIDSDVLNRPAQSVMKTKLLWLDPSDSVETAMQKMQQKNTRYALVKEEDRLEAVFSRSDLNAALSPYLKSAFEQYRRPLDDASLQIRIKWFMSRPVHTVTPETPLWKVMETMCRHSVRALPVQDAEGTVRGLITSIEIFRALVLPKTETPSQEPESNKDAALPSEEPESAEDLQPAESETNEAPQPAESEPAEAAQPAEETEQTGEKQKAPTD